MKYLRKTPRIKRSGAWALAAFCLLVFATVLRWPYSPHPAADALPASRAVVVVDTGQSVYVRVITFASSTVSGLDALRLAGADPVTVGYSSQGLAVCKLFGVGHEATTSSCLGTPSDPRYWAYFRAPSGATSYTYSSVGAGASRVHDGDVEGWKFGTGDPPPYYSLCEVAGCPDEGGSGQGGKGASSSEESGVGGSKQSGGGSQLTSEEGTKKSNAAAEQAFAGGLSSDNPSGEPTNAASEPDRGTALANDIPALTASDTLTSLSDSTPYGGLNGSDASEDEGTGALGPLSSGLAFLGALVGVAGVGVMARRRKRNSS